MLREMHGMSQNDLAMELHLEGRSAVGHIEHDRRKIGMDLVVRLSEIFDVSTDFILTGKDGKVVFDIEDMEFMYAAQYILREIRTDAGKKAALAHLRVVRDLEQ